MITGKQFNNIAHSVTDNIAVSIASLQSTPIISKSSFSVSCHLFQVSFCHLLGGAHSKVRLADLVARSRRMLLTNIFFSALTVKIVPSLHVQCGHAMKCPKFSWDDNWKHQSHQSNHYFLQTSVFSLSTKYRLLQVGLHPFFQVIFGLPQS